MTKFWTKDTALNIAVSAGTGVICGETAHLMGVSLLVSNAVTVGTCIVASLVWEFITGK